MIAADTNVLVRLLTADEPQQTERTRQMFETDAIFLSKTVVLETEWVLRRLYRHERVAINQALEDLLSLPNVTCEDEPLLRQALSWNREGMDFADAIHLASSRTASRFATFDLRTIKSARTLGLEVSLP